MKIRNRRMISLLLTVAVVFTMNTAAFAEEVGPDTVDGISIEDAADAAIDAYEPIENELTKAGKHEVDTIVSGQFCQVPDNWGINSDPATWPTATKIVSMDMAYYNTQADVPTGKYRYSGTFWVKEGDDERAEERWFDITLDKYMEKDGFKRYLCDEYFEREGSIDDYDYYCESTFKSAMGWEVFSPISYFFNPVDNHLLNGKVVVPVEKQNSCQKSNDENVIYRVIPAGTDTFVLVKITGIDGEYFDLGDHFEIIHDPVSGNTRIKETINNRYKGDEPILRYSGLKYTEKQNKKKKKKNKAAFKKGTYPIFEVDAVLIKRENNKNTLVKGLSVKKVKFKNNKSASLPEEYVNERISSVSTDGSGTKYSDGSDGVCRGYEFTYKAGEELSDVKYVGISYKDQLTNKENANFKGQPSFTVFFEAKGDAAKYKADIKKAQNAVKPDNNKEKMTTFNFEIAQLNIGDYRNDTYAPDDVIDGFCYTFLGEANEVKMKEAVKERLEKFREEYAADYRKKNPGKNDEEVREWVENNIWIPKGTDEDFYQYAPDGVHHDVENDLWIGCIYFSKSIPMNVDKEVDARVLRESDSFFGDRGKGQEYSDIKLEVEDDNADNLEFGKNNKVSAKLVLTTTKQEFNIDTGLVAGTERERTPVFKVIKTKAREKTTDKEGGKADVVLTANTVTDPAFGEIPYAVAKGQNNLTGAITIRKHTDAHGDDTVRYGHYKDENTFWVESIED